MNKTIYVRDEDVPYWDRAKELAGDKLSPVIVGALKQYIANKEAEEAESKGFERIEVSFNDAETHGLPRTRAFYGKWIFPPSKPYTVFSEDGYKCYNHLLAVTAKGNVVVLTWDEDPEGSSFRRFYAFPSLEVAAANHSTNSVVREAIQILGVPVEELDI